MDVVPTCCCLIEGPLAVGSAKGGREITLMTRSQLVLEQHWEVCGKILTTLIEVCFEGKNAREWTWIR